METKFQKFRNKEIDKITPSRYDDPSPWLERTGWTTILEGRTRSNLLRLVDSPDSLILRILGATFDLLAKSSHYILPIVGFNARFEVVKTEINQYRGKPLKPYQNPDRISEYSLPWKQILFFFCRTQSDEELGNIGPSYEFSDHQKACYLLLYRLLTKFSTWTEFENSIPNYQRTFSTPSTNSPLSSPSSSDNDSEEEASDSDLPIDTGKKPLVFYSLPKLQKSLLVFCISLLNYNAKEHENESVFIIALSVLGVKRNGWEGVDRFPSKLSSILKISRLLLIRYAYEKSSISFYSEIADSSDSSDSDTQNWVINEKIPNSLERLQYLMNRFMVKGTFSPISAIIDLRSYGMAIALDTTSIGQIDWRNDTIFYANISFSLSNFRSFVHGLVYSTRSLLLDELLFRNYETLDFPVIPWSKFRENPLDTIPFSNFIVNSAINLELKNPENWLRDRICNHKDLINRFELPGTEFAWNQRNLHSYFHLITKFLEKLMLLMHITGGQPPRAPEIFSVRFGNSINTGIRNVFLENGLICFVTYYHKGYSISGSTKIIHRYLPQEVGELYVYYLWLLVPFLQRVYADCSKIPFSEFLFRKIGIYRNTKKSEFKSDDLRRVFRRETSIGLNIAIKPSQYRHIAIGIARKFLKKGIRFDYDEFDFEQSDDLDNDDDIFDYQAAHTPKIDGTTYARGIHEREGEIATLKKRFREASLVNRPFLWFLLSI